MIFYKFLLNIVLMKLCPIKKNIKSLKAKLDLQHFANSFYS